MTKRTSPLALCCAILILSAVPIACGPELTDPADADVTGTWSGRHAVGVITGISVELVQGEDGILSGRWSGRATPPPGGCPTELGASPTNILRGTSTIGQVEFEMVGAGQYNGSLVTPTLLRGRILSCKRFYRLDFQLASRNVAP